MRIDPLGIRHRPIIRVFVSSTFSDLRHERDALQRDTFLRLEKLCAARQFQFQAIDLRWGVSSEAGLDHRAMRICFEELRRCQTVSPRPNFLILLGDRYGWRPLPEEISQEEFDTLVEAAAQEAERSVLRSWYRKDENAVPPVFVLQSRKTKQTDGRNYTLDDEWRKVEVVIWAVINRAFPPAGLRDRFSSCVTPDGPLPSIVRFQTSATEQEIWRGALCAPDAPGHVRAFVREIGNIEEYSKTAEIKDFIDVDGRGAVDIGPQEALGELKNELVRRLGLDNVKIIDHVRLERPLDERFDPKVSDRHEPVVDVTIHHLQDLCDQVYAALEPVITGQMDAYWAASTPGERAQAELERERNEHALFGQERAPTGAFIGRKEALRTISDYLRNDSRQPLVIHGAPGCGKTSLLAKAAQEAEERDPAVRFLGATPNSSDLRSLLVSLCQELRCRHPREVELPIETRELIQEMHEQFRASTAEKPLVIFLDALDQLGSADDGRQLNWIPFGPLPDHVKLIVSCLSDSTEDDLALQPLAALKRRGIAGGNFINLDALSEAEAQELFFDCWLNQANRKLNAGQRHNVERRLHSESCRLPLYLKILFEEARLWRSYDPSPSLGECVPELLNNLLGRLAAPASHGPTVECALGYIASGRRGLTETEILEVLYQDPRYRSFLAAMTKETGQPLPDTPPRIPIAVWSRLRFDLAPYLAEHKTPGGTVITFYHRQVTEYVLSHFLGTKAKRQQRHRRLAAYFRSKADPADNGSWDGQYPRALSELPFHQVQGQIWPEMVKTLCDLKFLEAKCLASMVDDLHQDFLSALDAARKHAADIEATLMPFAKTLRLGLSTLRRMPELAFQHFYNYLYWSEPPDSRLCDSLRAFREKHELGGACWLRSLWPFELTSAEAEAYTLEDCNLPIRELSAGPDAKWIAAVGMRMGVLDLQENPNLELVVWELPTAKPRLCMQNLYGAKLVGDRWAAVHRGQDGFELWDLEHCACIRSFPGLVPGFIVIDGNNLSFVQRPRSGMPVATLTNIHDDSRCILISGELALSPNGAQGAYYDREGKCIRLVEIPGGRELSRVAAGDAVSVEALLNNHRAVVTIGGAGKKVLLVDLLSERAQVLFEEAGSLKDLMEKRFLVIERERREVGGDGKKKAMVGSTFSVFDTEAMRPLCTIECPKGGVLTRIFSSADLALTAGNDEPARLWDLNTGRMVAELGMLSSSPQVVLLERKNWIAVSGRDTFIIWDCGSMSTLLKRENLGRTFHRMAADDGENLLALSTAEAGDRLVGETPDLWVLDLERLTAVSVPGHGYPPHLLRFTTDYLITASVDASCRVWDLKTLSSLDHFTFTSDDGKTTRGSACSKISGHSGPIIELELYHDPEIGGLFCLTEGVDGMFRMWRIDDRKCVAEMPIEKGSIEIMTHMPLRQEYARLPELDLGVAVDQGNLLIFKKDVDGPIRVVENVDNRLTCVVAHPQDPHVVFTGGWDTTIRAWRVPEGECVATFSGHVGSIERIGISPNGKILVATSRDDSIAAWDYLARKPLWYADIHRCNYAAFDFLGDGGHLAFGGGENGNWLRVCRADDGNSIACHVARSALVRVRCHDLQIVIGDRSGNIGVFELRLGRAVSAEAC